jgi:hypothetical protein
VVDRLGDVLLGMLGIARRVKVAADHPALAWRRAGLMAVTGPAERALVCPVSVTLLADAALAAFSTLSVSLPFNGALLLGERARMLRLVRQGQVSANGSCRLLQARDGWIALNLPREDDWDLAGAMVQQAVADWEGLGTVAASWACNDLVARGRELGLAVAPSRLEPPPAAPFVITPGGPARGKEPLVVDLSALWAGPLAGSLMAMAGARVIKVESRKRPDGAARGDPAFFALMNHTKERVVLDFGDAGDLAELRRLIAAADIVIEASRPRALRQLRIDAEAQVARGAVWISITAHGRAHDAIGYGDDAAVAGGLAAAMAQAWGQQLFAGDALADPLTGILAALAGWAQWSRGQGALVDIALADTVAYARRIGLAGPDLCRDWQARAEADEAPLYPLRITPSSG